MTRYVFKMPDLGEGTVAAEIVAWHVKVGDHVREEQIMAEVMTDKAAVEVPAPVTGRVLSMHGEPGDTIPVGAELIIFDTQGEAAERDAAQAPAAEASVTPPPLPAPQFADRAGTSAEPRAAVLAAATTTAGRIKASPATRRRAREAGVDLHTVAGSGPSGRITRSDLDAALAGGQRETIAVSRPPAPPEAARAGVEEIKVIGIRRLIAQRMAESKRNIPHFSYVEEVDVTELEALRGHLNGRLPPGGSALTYLPFIAAALTRVLERFPQCNALYDAERGVLLRHHAVHLGVATQTPDGLKVPVVRHAEARTLWDLAEEIRRVSEAARSGRATSKDLTGSTITVTSLGKLGGIASTPIINAPEMAIIGVNRAVERPVVLDGAVTVRRIMNLSSSFDHRFVDGYDAAAMIQDLKDFLEHPATIFIPG
ncbi:MAG TPA: dihydrolipoamide acetyltransferase family protein [Steroidobacteraceae bacterium]|nr:dihydrolipoamide acetyltransferase family protein [Steroidobacteraceae bacterium]